MVLTNFETGAIKTSVKAKLVVDFVEVAFGSGTATELPTDTTLQSETLQQARTDVSNLSDRVVISGFVGVGQLNGTTISEVGWKDAASGNLLHRKVINPFSKTSAKEFWTDNSIFVSVNQG